MAPLLQQHDELCDLLSQLALEIQQAVAVDRDINPKVCACLVVESSMCMCSEGRTQMGVRGSSRVSEGTAVSYGASSQAGVCFGQGSMDVIVCLRVLTQ